MKVQAALEASLAEEVGRIESWGCDVKSVLLAVDGLEAQLKQPKKKKEKEVRGSGEQIQVLSAPRPKVIWLYHVISVIYDVV